MAPKQKERRRSLPSLFGKAKNPATTKETFSPPPLFPLFTKLPPELQIQIWHYVLNEPSTKPHDRHSRLYIHTRTPDNHFSIGWSPCFVLSPALQVNRLSRQVACEYYLSLPQLENLYCGRAWSEYRELLRYFKKCIDRTTRRWITGSDEVTFLIFDYSHFAWWNLGRRHDRCTAAF